MGLRRHLHLAEDEVGALRVAAAGPVVPPPERSIGELKARLTAHAQAVHDALCKSIAADAIAVHMAADEELCVILEPMQELMSRHKAYALSPRDCLKTTLFQKWQKMVAPPGKSLTKLKPF